MTLHEACFDGDLEQIKLLINNNMDINQFDKDGYTPLYIACMFGYLEIVRLLLDHGASINKCTEHGYTSLYIACCNGEVEIIKLLLDHGIDVNQYTTGGCTPLYTQCINRNLEITRLLIDHGADINIKHGIGFTALDKAMKYENSQMVSLLQKVMKQWSLSRHHLAPRKKRLQIKTIFMLSIRRNNLFSQLPKDMLCVISTFLS